jgi:endonuclease-3
MPREGIEARKVRTREIIAGLRAAYPDAHCELNYRSPLQLLIATILSAQCTDKQVNVVTARLFPKYPSAVDYARSDPAELEEDVRAIGLFRNKSRNIRAACQQLVEQHQGEVPRTMEALIELDGVGRKTANVVLGNAFRINVGIVVDTHVARLSNRLALSQHTHPEKIELDLQKLVPQDAWTDFSHWLIWHGRRRCFARNPDCDGCEIKALCPSYPKLRPRGLPERA